jgi:hypothetical protein
MIEIVREFVAKEATRGQFELTFGPGGAWSKLFAQRPGFRGTTLLRDTENLHRYLLFELWDTAAQRAQALAELGDAYAQVEAALAGWSASRNELGAFRMLAETTVRPRGRARTGKRGRAGAGRLEIASDNED